MTRADVTSKGPHTVAAAMQAAALATLRLFLTSGAASTQSPADVLLPRLLAACADGHSDVREAALSCLQAAEQAPEALVASELMTASVLADLRRAVLEQQELIEGDPQATLQVCPGSDVLQGGVGPCSSCASADRDKSEARQHIPIVCLLPLVAHPALWLVHLLDSFAAYQCILAFHQPSNARCATRLGRCLSKFLSWAFPGHCLTSTIRVSPLVPSESPRDRLFGAPADASVNHLKASRQQGQEGKGQAERVSHAVCGDDLASTPLYKRQMPVPIYPAGPLMWPSSLLWLLD